MARPEIHWESDRHKDVPSNERLDDGIDFPEGYFEPEGLFAGPPLASRISEFFESLLAPRTEKGKLRAELRTLESASRIRELRQDEERKLDELREELDKD